jgi:hypothetical protein
MVSVIKVPQVLLLVCAGLASFYLAAHWSHATPEARDVLGPPVALVPARELSQPQVPTAPNVTVAVRDPTLELPKREHLVPATSGDAFAAVSWLPPPPKAAPPAPPPPAPAPTAPPLPFNFVGMLERGQDGVKPRAFLAKGEMLLMVAAGDLLESNRYHVDAIKPDQIVLTYLPMNTQQILHIPGAQP